MKNFDEGEQTKFVTLWNEYMGKGRSKDTHTNKIEFYVRIYFTIYPMHSLSKGKTNEKIVKQRQKEFKKFLDTKGSELSKTSEFLPYYALPYVQHPIEHPSFKQLFTMDWIKSLREKLIEFLYSQVNTSDETRLALIFEQGLKRESSQEIDIEDERLNEEMVEQINALQTKCRELEQKEQKTKLAFINSQQKWSNFSRNILIISKQLMTVIDNSDNVLSINTIVYRSMKEKIAKYENILKNIMEGQSASIKHSPQNSTAKI